MYERFVERAERVFTKPVFWVYALPACVLPIFGIEILGFVNPHFHGWAAGSVGFAVLGAVLLAAGTHAFLAWYWKRHPKPVRLLQAEFRIRCFCDSWRILPSVRGHDKVGLWARLTRRLQRPSSLHAHEVRESRLRGALRGERRKFAAIVHGLRRADAGFKAGQAVTSTQLGEGHANPGAARHP